MTKRIVEHGVRAEFKGVRITTNSPAGSLNGGTVKSAARRDGAARALQAMSVKARQERTA